VFTDPEGLEHELRVADVPDEPLIAHATEVPDEHALQGFDAVHAYTPTLGVSDGLLEKGLAFERRGEGEWEARGESRGGRIVYSESRERGVPGAGTVHHVAWAIEMGKEDEWRNRALEAGAQPTPVIDRFYFRSIYFREPSGVLFELATMGPGFGADEPLETLGERLSLPPDYEALRDRLEPVLTPLPDTRQWRRTGAPSQ
jgi:glyoxalase family protein